MRASFLTSPFRPMALDPAESTFDATFEACYRRYGDRVYREGLRYGGGRRDWAEDHVHDVFMKLHDHLARLAEPDDLGGWIYRVSANLAISRLRREQTHLGRLRAWLGTDAAEEPAVEGVDAAFERQELARALVGALAALPAKERVVVTMRLLDGRAQREIAADLDLSEGYVSKLFARGVARLEAAGWEVDDV